jgi:hypothetical protein
MTTLPAAMTMIVIQIASVDDGIVPRFLGPKTTPLGVVIVKPANFNNLADTITILMV